MPALDFDRLTRVYQAARDALLAERTPEGYWVGELSTSALATATAVGALALVERGARSAERGTIIDRGLQWLVEHQNADGGWGDTNKSLSNISTTMLCRAAFHLAEDEGPVGATGGSPLPAAYRDCLERAGAYLDRQCGDGPRNHAEGIRKRYGKDRTFSVPILMMSALAGLVPWDEVPALPFELACLPQSWFRFLRLPVVSYALPALIAIGQAVHHHRKPWNPITRLIRALSRKRSLRVLQRIQPSSGGFLEATPLTSFVVMALASIGRHDHPVVTKGVEFLVHSVRPDGSWPIDSNLSVWVTTLSINALAAAGELQNLDRLPELHDWLLRQQFQERHPYTGAAPGGWGWTHLPGSVPDADDSPGALLALSHLDAEAKRGSFDEAWSALEWLRGLENRDGGWPTFCRGWGRLAFDRSGPDLSAHALRAILTWRLLLRSQAGHDWEVFRGWRDELWCLRSIPGEIRHKCRGLERAEKRGLRYLAKQQRPDGSWLPLWFGNQHALDDENPTYGTARVLAAYRDLAMMDSEPARRGVAWLLAAQNTDGGWGGAPGVPSSVEETALAVEVLLDAASAMPQAAVNRGLEWLVTQVEAGGLNHPTPIGFYFAKLWYYEKLYPMIFTVAALGRARRKLCPPVD